MVLRENLGRLLIAVHHSILGDDALQIKKMGGEDSNFEKGWPFIHWNFIAETQLVTYRRK